MASYQPGDERFAAGGWTDATRDPRFVQRRLRGERLIFCETVTRIRTNRDLVMSKLRGPWNWWALGRSIGFHRNADGSSDQTIAPIWWYIARVGCRVLPPVTLPDGERGVRLPIYLSRHFVGLQTIDLIDAADQHVIVRGRFHGVENHFPVGGIELVTTVHLGAESGTLFFPFPRGTGWVGLGRALEDASGDRSAAARS
jgi:hypothetical protein